MTFPLYKMGAFGPEASLIVAFIIGIAFGFVLERAGFGSAKRLVAQFYFTNMRVFKVMFSAIVTAMLGAFFLSWIGWLDLSMVWLGETYLLPQAVGGLIFGFGFVVGGYCPGTSAVAISTGKLDALVFVGGVLAGVFAFDEAFPLLETFYASTPMGRVTLADAFHLPYGVVVFAVVLIALGGFAAAEWGEKVMARRAVTKEGDLV